MSERDADIWKLAKNRQMGDNLGKQRSVAEVVMKACGSGCVEIVDL
jgi:hypothetical protein